MRLVMMADTHSHHEDLDVPDGDVLIHAGDLTRIGRLEALAEVNAFLHGLPHRHKVVIAGNHDWCFVHEPAQARACLTAATYLEDQGVVIEGVRFWGSPWQPRFFDWAFNLDRGPDIAARWALIPDDTDVLVTHGPPRGIGDQTFDGRNEGCDDLLARVREVRPRVHVFGHIHESPGRWTNGPTTFINATVAECTLPVQVFDL